MYCTISRYIYIYIQYVLCTLHIINMYVYMYEISCIISLFFTIHDIIDTLYNIDYFTGIYYICISHICVLHKKILHVSYHILYIVD